MGEFLRNVGYLCLTGVVLWFVVVVILVFLSTFPVIGVIPSMILWIMGKR
jgi:hypothetical protein